MARLPSLYYGLHIFDKLLPPIFCSNGFSNQCRNIKCCGRTFGVQNRNLEKSCRVLVRKLELFGPPFMCINFYTFLNRAAILEVWPDNAHWHLKTGLVYYFGVWKDTTKLLRKSLIRWLFKSAIIWCTSCFVRSSHRKLSRFSEKCQTPSTTPFPRQNWAMYFLVKQNRQTELGHYDPESYLALVAYARNQTLGWNPKDSRSKFSAQLQSKGIFCNCTNSSKRCPQLNATTSAIEEYADSLF